MKAWADAYKAKFGLPGFLLLLQYDNIPPALRISAGADLQRS
jgi:hypothetical protein